MHCTIGNVTQAQAGKAAGHDVQIAYIILYLQAYAYRGNLNSNRWQAWLCRPALLRLLSEMQDSGNTWRAGASIAGVYTASCLSYAISSTVCRSDIKIRFQQ